MGLFRRQKCDFDLIKKTIYGGKLGKDSCIIGCTTATVIGR